MLRRTPTTNYEKNVHNLGLITPFHVDDGFIWLISKIIFQTVKMRIPQITRNQYLCSVMLTDFLTDFMLCINPIKLCENTLFKRKWFGIENRKHRIFAAYMLCFTQIF